MTAGTMSAPSTAASTSGTVGKQLAGRDVPMEHDAAIRRLQINGHAAAAQAGSPIRYSKSMLVAATERLNGKGSHRQAASSAAAVGEC